MTLGSAASRDLKGGWDQVGGFNDDFAPGLVFLHITDDWTLVELAQAVGIRRPQTVPTAPDLPADTRRVPVVVVSPGGHGNDPGQTSREERRIHQVDPPSGDAIRRVRPERNNGFGGSNAAP